MSRKVRIADVAACAGVSAATVDRVLNQRGGVSPAVESRVLACARELQMDRDLRRRPTRIVRVGVIMQRPENPFYRSLEHAFARAADGYRSRNVQIQVAYFGIEDAPVRVAALLDRAASRCQALIIVVHDDPVLRPVVSRIAAERPVVTLASDLPRCGRLAYVGIDNMIAGRVAGDLMGRFLGASGGSVIALTGLQRFVGQEERETGFRAVLRERYPACRLLSVLETREDAARAAELVRSALEHEPGLGGIYNMSNGDEAISRVLCEHSRGRHRVFITHELTPERRRLLRAGVLDAIIDQSPQREVDVALTRIMHALDNTLTVHVEPSIPVQIVLRENCA